MSSDRTNWAQTEAQEILSEHGEHPFHCKDDQAVAQVAHSDSGVSILGDTEKPSGHSCEQPDLADPVSNEFRVIHSHFNHCVILWKKNLLSLIGFFENVVGILNCVMSDGTAKYGTYKEN